MTTEFWTITIFVVLQFINVVLSTIRSIATINSTPMTAGLISAISFTFYNCIVKLITSQSMLVIIVVTLVTNILGVWLAKVIVKKMAKDKLWVYGVTYPQNFRKLDVIKKVLTEMGITYTVTETEKFVTMQVFSYTQADSRIITELLNKYGVKYYAVEAKEQRS